MNNYEWLILLFIIVIGVVCLAVIVIALYELHKAHKEDEMEREMRKTENDKQAQERQEMMNLERKLIIALQGPIVFQGMPGNVQVAKEEPVKEKINEPVSVEKSDPDGVHLHVSERLPIKEAYQQLSKKQQGFFDAIDKKFDELGASRILRSTYHYIVKQGQDTLGKLTIKKDLVQLECFVFDPELKKYSKENKDRKIKPRGMKFLIKEKADLEPAFVSLDIALRRAIEFREAKDE
ncbi:MAG: hypothetical protein K6F07_00070 [Bacilli bacterium]|nr:hypothetical protein [Bacilli bacterium]